MTVQSSAPISLLAFDPIAAAVTGSVGSTINLGPVQALTLFASFLYGAGGTTVKAWVQTSFDGGATWMDIANFAFTTAAAKRAHHLTAPVNATIVTPGDATLGDGLLVNSFLGPLFRVKYTTTGTYSGASSLNIFGYAK